MHFQRSVFTACPTLRLLSCVGSLRCVNCWILQCPFSLSSSSWRMKYEFIARSISSLSPEYLVSKSFCRYVTKNHTQCLYFYITTDLFDSTQHNGQLELYLLNSYVLVQLTLLLFVTKQIIKKNNRRGNEGKFNQIQLRFHNSFPFLEFFSCR